MPKPNLQPIDTMALETVTGGTRNAGTDLANQLSAIADSVTCLSQKTSGFSSNQFLLFAALAIASQRQGSGVVYVGGPRYWW
jgi:hypothetical protein